VVAAKASRRLARFARHRSGQSAPRRRRLRQANHCCPAVGRGQACAGTIRPTATSTAATPDLLDRACVKCNVITVSYEQAAGASQTCAGQYSCQAAEHDRRTGSENAWIWCFRICRSTRRKRGLTEKSSQSGDVKSYSVQRRAVSKYQRQKTLNHDSAGQHCSRLGLCPLQPMTEESTVQV